MADAPLILALDRNPRNLELLRQFLSKAGYEVASATSLDEFEALLAGTRSFGVALIDLAGLDRRVWAHCERLRQRGIPFVLIARQRSAAIERAGHDAGARDVMVKPISAQSLLGMIHSVFRK